MSNTTSTSRPIIFTQEMIAAILAGAKSQTRRLVTPQPAATAQYHHTTILNRYVFTDGHIAECPFGERGDRLYVRETHWMYGRWDDKKVYVPASRTKPGYVRAGRTFVRACPAVAPIVPLSVSPVKPSADGLVGGAWHKRPAIFMPKEASRLTLQVEAVRAERLHAITEADAQREGVKPYNVRLNHFASFTTTQPHKTAFIELWDEINADRAAWKTNPMVYVVDFSIASRA